MSGDGYGGDFVVTAATARADGGAVTAPISDNIGCSGSDPLQTSAASQPQTQQQQQVVGPLLRSREELMHLLEATLPLDQVVYAFGYGSGVLSQHQNHSFTTKATIGESSNGAQHQQQPLQQQLSHSHSQSQHKMIDMILVVRDAYAFHEANLQRNPDHYSVFARQLSSVASLSSVSSSSSLQRAASVAAWVQRHQLPSHMNWLLRNPGVYFHVVSNESEAFASTLGSSATATLGTPGIKYGIVHVDDLTRDLTDWSDLYIAGRLHKPVVTIMNDSASASYDDETAAKLHSVQHGRNIPAAFAAALLLEWNDHRRRHEHHQHHQQQIRTNNNNGATASDLPREGHHEGPHEVDAVDLYTRITSLSYTGDPRMALRAEDPNKVANLVQAPGQQQRFDDLYQTAFASL
jgi:hypothetical protein